MISPPFGYYIWKASKILGCSYIELEGHPDIARLMTLAFTYDNGDSEGEYLRELNPEWQRKKKSMSEAMQKASK